MALDVSAPYILEYIGEPDYTTAQTGTDITRHVQTIDKITRTGTGEINSAKFMLDSRFGAFVTEDDGGATPIIQAYDLFRLTVGTSDTDKYVRYLITDDRSPQKGEGANLPLELFGLERYLQTMYFLGLHQNVRFTDLVKAIVAHYNANRGTAQPLLAWPSVSQDSFPYHAWGTFEFGNQTTVYEALMAVVKRLGLSVDAGGGGQQYSLFFQRDTSNGVPALNMLILPQGHKIDPTNTANTVDDADITLSEPRSLTRVQSPPEGTIVVVEGKPGSGSFPVEPTLYNSLIEEYVNTPEWVTQFAYKDGAYVRSARKMYQANKDINVTTATAAPPQTATADWDEITFDEYVMDQHGTLVISPWTHNKAAEWKAVAKNTFTDTNLVIRDSGAGGVDSSGDVIEAATTEDANVSVWRDWVDYKVSDLDDVPDKAKYGDSLNGYEFYDGFRVLYTGTNIDSSSTDKEGLTYHNSLCMYFNKKWIVIREAQRLDECAVTAESKIWEYNKEPSFVPNNNSAYLTQNTTSPNSTTDLDWRSSSDFYLPNDCFHPYTSVTNVDGLLGADPNGLIPDVSTYTDNSAIKIVYTIAQNEVLGGIVRAFTNLGLFTDIYKFLTGTKTVKTPNPDDGVTPDQDDDDTKTFIKSDKSNRMGWWVTLFEAPFPKEKLSVSKGLGYLFGGTRLFKRPLLHLQNLVQTPSGKTGYDQIDSESLGPLDKIHFLFNFRIVHRDTNDIEIPIPYIGEVPYTSTGYDIYGTRWVAKGSIRLLGLTEPVVIPFSAYKPKRSRVQPTYQIANFIHRAINPELKVTDIFDTRFMKRINLQIDTAYDDQDRYDPWSFQNILFKLGVDLIGDVRYEGIIDMLYFTKTPIAIAKDSDVPTGETESELDKRHVMSPIKKYPGVSNVRQLKKIAMAEIDIAKFHKDEWTYTHESFLNVEVGETVLVLDTDYIEEDSDGNTNHTRKYIIKKVTYTIGDRTASSAFTTTLELFRRIGGYP